MTILPLFLLALLPTAPSEFCDNVCPSNGQEVEIGAAPGRLGDAEFWAKLFLGEDVVVEGKPYTATPPPPNNLCLLHCEETHNSTRYWIDEKKFGGADDDPTHGIERSTLLFYVGHGYPDRFQTIGGEVELEQVVAGDGKLRYLWMCTCTLMAHGPASPQPGDEGNYRSPWDYPTLNDKPADHPLLRNVFDRWAEPFGPNLRLACGGSTFICSDKAGIIDSLWARYKDGLFLADSFLQATSASTAAVSLCITRGGEKPVGLAFDDREIKAAAPERERPFMYIMYPRPITLQAVLRPPSVPCLPPLLLPVRNLMHLERLEQEADEESWGREGIFLFSEDRNLKLNSRTGSWTFVGEPPVTEEIPEGAQLPDSREILRESLETLGQVLESRGPHQGLVTLSELDDGGVEVQGERLYPEATYLFRVDGSEDEGETVTRYLRSKNAEYRRWILVPEHRDLELGIHKIPVIGRGGMLRVQTASDGRPSYVQLDWHPLDDSVAWQKVLPFEKALDEAKKRLQTPDHYRLDDFRWGYWEEPGHCAQTTLSIAYEFDFVAAGDHSAATNPPRQIVVHAQDAGRKRAQCPPWDDE